MWGLNNSEYQVEQLLNTVQYEKGLLVSGSTGETPLPAPAAGQPIAPLHDLILGTFLISLAATKLL